MPIPGLTGAANGVFVMNADGTRACTVFIIRQASARKKIPSHDGSQWRENRQIPSFPARTCVKLSRRVGAVRPCRAGTLYPSGCKKRKNRMEIDGMRVYMLSNPLQGGQGDTRTGVILGNRMQLSTCRARFAAMLWAMPRPGPGTGRRRLSCATSRMPRRAPAPCFVSPPSFAHHSR